MKRRKQKDNVPVWLIVSHSQILLIEAGPETEVQEIRRNYKHQYLDPAVFRVNTSVIVTFCENSSHFWENFI